jgi:hypothetical protein
VKLNGERKLKPGPKPKALRMQLGEDACAPDTERRLGVPRPPAVSSVERRAVGRPKKDPNAWSDEQLEALQNAQVRVDLGRKNFWTEVASYVPGKTAQQCKDRVYSSLNIGDDDDDENTNEEEDHRHDNNTARAPITAAALSHPPARSSERTLTTPTRPNTSMDNTARWHARRGSASDTADTT